MKQEPTRAQQALGAAIVIAGMVLPKVFEIIEDKVAAKVAAKTAGTVNVTFGSKDKIDELTLAKAEVAALDEKADTLADTVATAEDALSDTEAALKAAEAKVDKLTEEKEQHDTAAAEAEEQQRNRRARIRAKARGEGDDGTSSQPARV